MRRKIRVLIFSQHYPPEPNGRLKDLTQHLVAQGYQVSVLTTFPSYPLGRVYDGYRLGLYSRSREQGVPVLRVFAVPYRGAVKTKRMVCYFSFAIAAFVLGLLPHRRPDLIYAFHPPLTVGMAAALFNRLTGTPFVYDVQDLWPDAIVAAGMLSEGSTMYRGIRWVEDYVYRRARQITVLSEGMKKNLLGKGVPESKITVTPNWSDPDLYHPMENEKTRADLGWKNRFVVMMAGNMGLTHGLETVVESAARLRDLPQILFVFLGSGAAKAALVEQVETQHLDNVVFHDQVPPSEAARLINAADLMLVHLKEGEFSVPHRIFSYMLCGKPIVAAATGETGELIESLDCGWKCLPSDAVALSALLRQVSADPQKCREVGLNGLSLSNLQYGRDILLERLEKMISGAHRDSIASSKGSSAPL